MLPVALILGAVFWILLSTVKYWYFSKMKINYTNKLDEAMLEELRRPSKQATEKMKNKMRDHEKRYKDGTSKLKEDGITDHSKDFTSDAGNNCQTSPDDDTPKQKSRPLTLFEEMDLLKKKGKKVERKPSKYDRSMFDDPLTRLHRDIQELKRKSVPQ